MTSPYQQLFQKLTNWLADYQNRQQELIDLIAELTPANSLHDKEASDAEWSPMREMDPFTFLTFFLRYRDRKNVEYLNELARRIKLDVSPIDHLYGVPTPNNQSSWFFGYAYRRKPEDIPLLWTFFNAARNESITDDLYQQVQGIWGMGYTKITEGLFRMLPDQFFPVNGPTKQFLADHELPHQIDSWQNYQDILEAVRDKFPDQSFAEVSRNAWVTRQKGITTHEEQGVPAMLVCKTGSSTDWEWWSAFQQQGIAAVSYREMQVGDLSRFASATEIRNLQDQIEGYQKGLVEILWNFATAPEGSIVFAGKGRDRIVGVGQLTGPYRFSPDDPSGLFHQREVEWFGETNYTYTGKGHLMRLNSFGTLRKYPLVLEHIAQNYPPIHKRLLEAGVPSSEFGDASSVRITTEQWAELLRTPSVFQPKDLQMIAALYHSPNHENRADWIDAIMKGVDQSAGKAIRVNSRSANLAKRIIAHLDIDESQLDKRWEDDTTQYWAILYTITPAKGRFPYRLRPELTTAFSHLENTSSVPSTMGSHRHTLNQILYGPPGTGKTYATVTQAVAIIEGKQLTTVAAENRTAVQDRFRHYQQLGRIRFTTFHQSLSYEDFVEGLKPTLEGEGEEAGNLSYEVVPGIFREIVTDAAFEYTKQPIAQTKGSTVSFAAAWEAFLENVSDLLDKREPVLLTTRNARKAEIIDITKQGNLQVKHQEGDRVYTISTDRQARLNDAFPDLEKVTNINDAFREIIGGSNSSLQYAVLDAVQRYGKTMNTQDKAKRQQDLDAKGRRLAVRSLKTEDFRWPAAAPYVLIIDEINRGNVAAILGELITLLEPAKRLGKEEALTLTLPYSRHRFGVPANLHLIGTMNTADRSVETLDAALRRRFSFLSVPPDTEVLHQVLKDDVTIEVDDLSVNLADLLDLLNARIIALRDADHAIGHSYFLNVRGWRSLRDVFCDRLIPLLREYFFGTPGQLQLILGRGFCRLAGTSEVSFAPTDADNNASGTNFTVYSFPRPVDATALALCLRQLGLT